MNDVRVSARMALKPTGTTKAPPAKLRYRYFLGVKWFRTPPSVGPMLAMKRFSWPTRSLPRSKMAPEIIVVFIVINERESTRNAVPDYSNGFDGTRLPS